jgi:UDP-N-acetylglucosamine 2-epimerase (non-hydrolysing)
LDILAAMRLEARSYAVMTMHRPSNVDDVTDLKRTLDSAGRVGARLPVVFPAHPRTMKQLEHAALDVPDSVVVIDPLGYIDFLALMDASCLVLTDSGGLQEETSILGIPCLTLRPNTERPITCELGTNQVVGTDPHAVEAAAESALSRTWRPATIPLWDGHTAERIVTVLVEDLA